MNFLFDVDGTLIWNYRYLAPGREVHVTNSSEIDLFIINSFSGLLSEISVLVI